MIKFSRFHWGVLTALYMGGLFCVSLMPGDTGHGSSLAVRTFKNLLHIPAYAGLTYLLIRCFLKFDLRTQIGAFVIAVGYGVFNEFVQTFVPNRFYSLEDMLRNAIGAFAMIWIIRMKNGNTR